MEEELVIITTDKYLAGIRMRVISIVDTVSGIVVVVVAMNGDLNNSRSL
tara:strand:+ start:482 stop:628 length:147 start_codon:yes stop_codon:yes gene_type:complete